MPDFEPRRVYKQAGVEADSSFFRVVLDGRPAKTPARSDLVVPSAALAEAIAEEWNVQGDVVAPLTMPLTVPSSPIMGATEATTFK